MKLLLLIFCIAFNFVTNAQRIIYPDDPVSLGGQVSPNQFVIPYYYNEMLGFAKIQF